LSRDQAKLSMLHLAVRRFCFPALQRQNLILTGTVVALASTPVAVLLHSSIVKVPGSKSCSLLCRLQETDKRTQEHIHFKK
jgi:hypothetical protein